MPGLGIVAAVLGIVITMQAIDGPVEQIGHKVGAALVGQGTLAAEPSWSSSRSCALCSSR